MNKKKIVYVNTGEVKTSDNGTILKSSPIGSCIVITAYDTIKKIGAMAHFMLPGKAPEKKEDQKTRYAENAMEELISEMNILGAKEKNIEVCLTGGANVMKRKNDTIAGDNIISANTLLKKRNIIIKAMSVGGTERRSVSLDVGKGLVNYTIGDGSEKVLCHFAEKKYDKEDS